MTRVRRSVLFVPGSDRAALRGALESGPDTLVVDPRIPSLRPASRPPARSRSHSSGSRPRPVPNGPRAAPPPATPYFSDDLPAVIAAGADALVLPKGNSAGEVRAV